MYNHIQHKAVVAIQQLNIAPQRAFRTCAPLNRTTLSMGGSLVPSTRQTVTHIAYEATQQGLQLL